VSSKPIKWSIPCTKYNSISSSDDQPYSAALRTAVSALTIFARGGSWAWAVGGVVAAAIGALAIAGSALGWVTGMLVAGVVLLAIAGLLFLARQRTATEEVPTSAPVR